ncbi:beta-galactosidase [Geothrix limicola]|uniref:Beta-galactosidase n=1 Tax=Geothrix limicola TaxID=2927978 RepID=A0ABQ5QCS5_9BACT|nr:beta-galactosidase [Geothrix limicola]GLH72637.1 beta-galactosidase [Geothrix limicola]
MAFLRALLFCAAFGALAAPGAFPRPDRIRYDGHCLTLDGQDTLVYSAAFHYFRCPKELWRDRFRKIKAAGFNTVESYVPWNWHERSMPAGLDDFSKCDFRDLQAWMRMAHDEFGLYTILRPGPFICAEWSGGAYPRWLAKFAPGGSDLWLRSAHPDHIRWAEHWYAAVVPVLAREQVTRKPKGAKGLILVQLENEYDNHECAGKETLLRALRGAALKAGLEVPLFTCLTEECRASKDAELSQVFDSDNYYVGLREASSCAHRMADLRRRQSDAPGFVTELQGGWFSLVGGRLSEEHYSDERHFQAIALMSLLGGATGMNVYMACGGTHFEGWGARGMTTTYDYNAPIRENGTLGPKYAVAKALGGFLRVHGRALARAEGGPCELQGASKELVGGVRVAQDGTRFVFLHNSGDAPLRGKVRVMPASAAGADRPMYNTDQHGNQVLVKARGQGVSAASIPSFEIGYELEGLGSKVLVLPPGLPVEGGTWWPRLSAKRAPIQVPGAPVRLLQVQAREDAWDRAQWQPLTEGVSLPELGVSDHRYVLYRARVRLDAVQAARETNLLFNTFSRDIVSVLVNGQPARRTFPLDADAQSWPTRKADARIRSDEFDNRFDVAGLLREGGNEIVAVYENLGHAHGYVPMEELSGLRRAGLSTNEAALTHTLSWEVAPDLGGLALGWQRPETRVEGWKNVDLDGSSAIPRKGNRTQPKGARTGLVTWYRAEFELPRGAAGAPWRALVNASGNGYLWLNGYNLGRHWEVGPQREFYLPECWLRTGKGRRNVLVFALRQTADGALLKALEIAPYTEVDPPKR